MGYNLYITRAEFWAENEGAYISADEWMDIVEKDPSLTLDPENGAYDTTWEGKEEYWLDWSGGNIYSKYPDAKLTAKMCEIAEALGARVMGEDGEIYEPGKEPYYPEGESAAIIVDPKKVKLLKMADLLFIVIALIGCFSLLFSDGKAFDLRYVMIGVGVIGTLLVAFLQRTKWIHSDK